MNDYQDLPSKPFATTYLSASARRWLDNEQATADRMHVELDRRNGKENSAGERSTYAFLDGEVMAVLGPGAAAVPAGVAGAAAQNLVVLEIHQAA